MPRSKAEVLQRGARVSWDFGGLRDKVGPSPIPSSAVLSAVCAPPTRCGAADALPRGHHECEAYAQQTLLHPPLSLSACVQAPSSSSLCRSLPLGVYGCFIAMTCNQDVSSRASIKATVWRHC